MNLTQYLAENPVNDLEEKIFISDRFKDEKGKAALFTIKIMTSKEHSSYQKEATRINARAKDVKFDNDIFNKLIVINHCVDPNLKDAASIKKAGCTTPEQFADKCLKAGELQTIATAVMELSGFSNDINKEIDEVKNS